MEEEYIKIRKQKLENLKKAGVDPYPAKFVRTHTTGEALQLKLGSKKIRLAGRLMLIREMGRICFCHIQDGEGKMQIVFSEKEVGKEKFKFFIIKT